MRTCLTLALAFLSFSSLFAQWERTNGPFGGTIDGLAKNDDYVFSANYSGLYRSADGGHSWNHLTIADGIKGYPSSLGVNGTTVMVLTSRQGVWQEERLFKSDDNGDSWTELSFPDTITHAEIFVTNYAIYLLKYQALLLSTDGGQSWQNSSLNTMVDYPNVMTINNQQVYVGGAGKIFRSETNADIWTEIPIQGISGSLNILFVSNDVIFARDVNQNPLYYSKDGGQSWQQSSGSNWGNGFSNFVQIGNTYYANGVGTIVKTENYGETWEQVSTTAGHNFYKMLALGDNILGGSFYEGILISADFGLTFHPSNQGLSAAEVVSLAVGNGELLAGCNYVGMFKYDQSQEVWDTTIYSAGYSNELDIAVIEDKIFVTRNYGDVVRSDDGGLTWVNVTPGQFGIETFNKLTVDEGTLYAAGTASAGNHAPLYKTVDFGQTWTQVSIQLNGNTIQPYFFAKNDEYIFHDAGQNIIRSADGGQTWEYASQGLVFDNFAQIQDLIVANNLVFAIIDAQSSTSTRLFVSHNGGDQWQLAENGIPFQNSFGGIAHLIGVNGVLVATTLGFVDGVFISSDSAQTWLPFSDGLSSNNAVKLAADGTYLYAGMGGQGVWRRSLADLNLESVTGKVFLDENNNGIQDNGEPLLPGPLLKLENTPSIAVSRSDGNYEIFSSFLQPDVLSAVPPNPYAFTNPSNYTVTQSESGKDFGIYFPPGIADLKVELTQYGVLRPGFASHYGIAYKNVGTTVMNGQVQLTLDAQLVFAGANPAPNQTTGNVLTWDFTDLQLLETRAITVDVLVPTSVPNGSGLSSSALIYPIVNDAAPTNNQDTEMATVVGSYDPNDKRVEPGEALTLEDLAAGIPLTYTIRFQNTGTYQADRVHIVDNLSQMLDVSTFQFLASSHPCTYNIRGNGLLEFDFDMINLPDSTSNEQASHGFVKFSIRPKTDLPIGALIQNKASIYFDFNLPIITNQVTTRVVEITTADVTIHQPAHALHIYPNPNAGDFTLRFESRLDEALELAVFDLQGRMLLRKNGLTNQLIKLSMPHLSSGIYVVKGKSGGTVFLGKVLIQR